jgi:hypothetical protein
LDFDSASSLEQYFTGRQVIPFQANQSLLLIINAVCLTTEKQQIQIYSLWFNWIGAQTLNLEQSALEASMLNYYTSDVVKKLW